MEKLGVFPFGQPILPVVQKDCSKKRVFVLGVYASAVHARWAGEDGSRKISAVAVASEPEIFWRGSQDAAREIIASIRLPKGAGSLEPANDSLNGPSGKTLDTLFLEPLGLSRDDAWLCDLVPHSCMNPRQEAALNRAYDPVQIALGLPKYEWPRVPDELADETRRRQIESELLRSGAELLITLGDKPLQWFACHYGTCATLSAFGRTAGEYGRPRPLTVAGRKMQLLPTRPPATGRRTWNSFL